MDKQADNYLVAVVGASGDDTHFTHRYSSLHTDVDDDGFRHRLFLLLFQARTSH